jgi:uncharacterized cupredoxin-like copper-binding protein
MRRLSVTSTRRFVVVFVACLAVVGTAVSGFAIAGVLAPKATALTTNVTVTMVDEAFTLSRDTVPAGTVVFTVTNNGDEQHDFSINGQTTPLVSHGGTVTLTVQFNQTSDKDYPYLCNVGEHAIHGMQGVLHVTGSSATTTTSASTTTTTTPPPSPVASVRVFASEFKFVLTGTTNKVVKTYATVKVKYRVKVNGKFVTKTKVVPKLVRVKYHVKVNGKLVTKTKLVRKVLKTTTTRSVPDGLVRFTVANVGHIAHNFVIGGEQTLVIAPGKSQVLDLTLKPGKYGYICSIAGHAAAGMKGTLVAK